MWMKGCDDYYNNICMYDIYVKYKYIIHTNIYMWIHTHTHNFASLCTLCVSVKLTRMLYTGSSVVFLWAYVTLMT